MSAITPSTDRQAASSMALAPAAAAFLSQRDLQPRTRIIYGTTLRRLTADVGAEVALARLQPRTLRAFMDRHYSAAAPTTWNLNLAALRSFLAYSTRQGWLSKDPTAGLETRRNRNNPDRRVIPAAELAALWTRTEFPLREKTLWHLLYDTAGRADEILRARVRTTCLFSAASVVWLRCCSSIRDASRGP